MRAQLLLLFLSASFSKTAAAKFNFKITKYECLGSNKTFEACSCYLRAYTRRSPVVNIELVFKRKLPNLLVSSRHFHRLTPETPPKLIFSVDGFPLCKVLTGGDSTPFYKLAVEWIASMVKDLPLVCSTVGEVKFTNITYVQSPFINFFPSGYYTTFFNFSDDVDQNLLKVVNELVLLK